MTASVSWDIPTSEGSCQLSLSSGETAVVIGANGTGKSALSHWLATHVPDGVPVLRLLAHRKLWMSSSGPETTLSNYESYRSYLDTEDRNASSRYRDAYSDQRSANTLFRLLGKINHRNAVVAGLVDAGSDTSQVEASPLMTISQMMHAVGLNLRFHVTARSSFEVERDGARYPIEQMSDGEKAAFLLASEVLLANPGVIILDEPERHLHRSISARLIMQLCASRADCSFVIFTHDLALASQPSLSGARLIILQAVTWAEQEVAHWDLRSLPPAEPIPDEARLAVLGGRDQVLFVEGTGGSLDVALFEHLYPDWTIRPGGTCREVIQAVTGLRTARGLHWIMAAAIVDGDARTPEECSALCAQGILALPVNEVESLYYLSEVLEAMAAHQERQLALPASSLYGAAIKAAIKCLENPDVQSHLAAANVEKILHRSLLSKAPARASLPNQPSKITISLTSPYPAERAKIADAVKSGNWQTIVENFSVRDSPALDVISKALHYPNRDTYERAVQGKMRDDLTLVAKLRTKIGQLPLK